VFFEFLSHQISQGKKNLILNFKKKTLQTLSLVLGGSQNYRRILDYFYFHIFLSSNLAKIPFMDDSHLSNIINLDFLKK
jgi:hypothetical protein